MKRKESDKAILVCGAGHQGLSMAAHLALNGEKVNVWNRSLGNIEKIKKTKCIHCSGIVHGDARVNNISTEIDEVISDFIMVTTPSTAHKDIARIIAPYLNPDSVVVLNPGRTFGAVEFAEGLKKCGINDLPHIAETQTIVYTCRKKNEDSTTILAMKKDVEIAAIKGSDIDYIMSKMPKCLLDYFRIVNSVGYTSLANIGMIIHCAPVLMNVGWIESENVDFKYYYDGISPSISQLLEKMDLERCAVAKAWGYDVESIVDWMNRTYGLNENSLFECIRNNKAYKEIDAPTTINTRYIFEDVPNGLVPIEGMAEEANMETPIVTTIINLANTVMGTDFRENGRIFDPSILRNYF